MEIYVGEMRFVDLLERIGKYFNKQNYTAWVFLFPSILCLVIFVFIPVVASFGMSLFDVNIFLKDFTFIKFDNFTELMNDSRFWNAFKNTAYYTALFVPIGIGFSLAVAVYVQKNTLFRKSLRSIYYIPVICSMTAMGIVWAILLDPTIGMFAYWARILGFENIRFLKDPDLAMPIIVFMSIWKTFGVNMIILVAGIQSIPNDYYEAAMIDGANKFKQFLNITIPSLIPTLGFCTVTTIISAFMVFDQTYIMTQGGPMFRTETLVQYIYVRGFSTSPFRLGYASTVAVMLFLVIAAITVVVYNYFIKKETRGL